MAKKILYLIVEGISNGSDVMVGVEGLSTTKRDIIKMLNARYREVKGYYKDPNGEKCSESFDIYESTDVETRNAADIEKVEIDFGNTHGKTNVYLVVSANSDGQGNFYPALEKACLTEEEAKEAVQSLYDEVEDYYNPPEEDEEEDDDDEDEDMDSFDLYDEDDIEHHTVTDIIKVEINLK